MRSIDLVVSDAAKAALVAEGYDPTYGARPLRRVIQRQVENQVSKRLLAGEFAEGDAVLVDRTDSGYTFTKAEPASAAA
jgi:ATP-dependent Clp protease ATP-binding subunit ClpA